MSNLGKQLFLLFVFFAGGVLFIPHVNAQQLWTNVKFNKGSVYVGEPMEVTVSVYTSTWFTAGVDPGNVKVNGAYTVFFRNVSTSKTVNGKTVSGVDMIFNVFPNSSEDISFPELKIEVETPAEGDYKGKKHILKTKVKRIKVRPIPPGFSQQEWLVTSYMSVRQNWSGNLNKVKVGDVITRTISRNVSNSVSQLIPQIMWDSVLGVSMYPTRSNVESHRSSTAISAERTETMRYLLEREGEVILPEMKLQWWNPYQKKLFERTLEAVKLDVQANPDLGMLVSIRDSLNVLAANQENELNQVEKEAFTIFGFRPVTFTLLCILLIVLLYFTYHLLVWAIKYRRKYLERYYNSEPFFWKIFVKSVRKGKKEELVNSLYLWITKLELLEPTVRNFAAQFGDEDLQKEVQLLEKKMVGESTIRLKLTNWKKARKRFLNAKNYQLDKQTGINP